MSNDTAGLILEGVHVYYGDSHIIQGVDLQASKGCVALLGRNGMGKTTLLRSIMGLTPPRRGTITWENNVVSGEKPYSIAKRGIGYVPQGRRLFKSLTVDEHLTVTYRKQPSANEWSPDRVYEIFPELWDRRKISGTRLSGGEQQMLAIGRALVTNPRIILFDEPSEGLAPIAINRVIDTVNELKHQGIAILLVEQNIHVAEALADQVYIMVSGQIKYQGQAHDFLQDQELRRKYLSV